MAPNPGTVDFQGTAIDINRLYQFSEERQKHWGMRELRNKIYYLVLVSDDGGKVDITLTVIHPRTMLLRVSSQIRSEATELFFNSNDFCISDIFHQEIEINRFVDYVGSNISLIPKLTIQIVLPELYLRLLDVTDAVVGSADADSQKALAEATLHVVRAVTNSIKLSTNKLIDAGIGFPSIQIQESNYDQTMLPITAEQTAKLTILALEKAFKGILLQAAYKVIRETLGPALDNLDKEDGDVESEISDNHRSDDEGYNQGDEADAGSGVDQAEDEGDEGAEGTEGGRVGL